MKKILVFVAVLTGTAGASSCWEGKTSFASELEARSLKYFLDQSHPKTGLVRDRARNFAATPKEYRAASLAATGFGMAVLANAALRDRLPKADAKDRISRTLAFVEKKLDHRKGWLYHFVDWETGRRAMESEISTVDTALFLAGALYAAEAFPNSAISEMVYRLYGRLEFDEFRTDGDKLPKKLTLTMGWTPERGFYPDQWDHYSEHLILQILGLGHPDRPLPKESWRAWRRQRLNPTAPLGSELPLFVHQYSFLFLDLRRQRDGVVDYFANSVAVTNAHRKMATAGAKYKTMRAGFWGISASDSPRGYQAFSPEFSDGTLCPGCAAASAPFAPKAVLADLENWARGEYCKSIWGNYGFVDGVNLDQDWFATDVIGITVGAAYLGLANLDSQEPPWRRFSEATFVRRALARAALTER